jgi:predicted regulator of Ras-like GTPase activity (Roadblock/LC7/MglB family)
VTDAKIHNEDTPTPPTAGTEALQAILKDLNACSGDIRLSLVISGDGLTMATLGEVEDADRAGAMCAALLTLCRSTSMDLQHSEVEQALVTGNEGCMLLIAAGPHAILAVFARPRTNLGLLMVDARRAAETIRQVL